jgi:hypothetical protein
MAAGVFGMKRPDGMRALGLILAATTMDGEAGPDRRIAASTCRGTGFSIRHSCARMAAK